VRKSGLCAGTGRHNIVITSTGWRLTTESDAATARTQYTQTAGTQRKLLTDA